MRSQTHAVVFLSAGLTTSLIAGGCTGQLPSSFRLLQQEQTFESTLEINTKIDLLWVVDNSASMDVSQHKLRSGFASFARKYLQPTWDIRVAVITTDTYMANPAFSGYLAREVPGTRGWTSPHIQSRLSTWVNPSWNPTLVNPTTGRFDSGVRYGELVPVWGSQFARLLPGLHDGPIPGLCFEVLPYFIGGVTRCAIRDDRDAYSGSSQCVTPDTANGESSVSQCVNTVQNDTIRSGRPILRTQGAGLTTDELIHDFIVNVSVGSVGQGSERGLGSIQQLLRDNESTSTAFFRPGSLRGIVIVSDEEDQTMRLPSPIPSGFSPQSHYRCDQASLVALNGAAAVTGMGGYCCSNASNGCVFGSEGTSCASKTIDGHTYAPSICPRPDRLVPVSEVKAELDEFFEDLDGAGAEPNYFVASIVPLTGAAIQSLQAARTAEDTAVGTIRTVAVDRGDRYLELGRLVGNDSLEMNIADSDYTPILEALGRSIIEKRATFTLARAPTNVEDMIVRILHQDGGSTEVPRSILGIEGKILRITDIGFVLTLASTDRILINYQPKTVN